MQSFCPQSADSLPPGPCQVFWGPFPFLPFPRGRGMVLPYGHTPLPFTAYLPEAWKSFVCTLFVGSTGKMTVSGGRPDDAAEDAIPAGEWQGNVRTNILPSVARHW